MLAVVVVILGICGGHNAVYSPTAALYSEMFPAHVRYSGASLGYQLGGAIAGFVPLQAASLVGSSRRFRPAHGGITCRRRRRRLLADRRADRGRGADRVRLHPARTPAIRPAG